MMRLLALTLAMLFITASGWLWFNEEAVDSWLSEQLIVTPAEEEALLGLQPSERWLVVVVEFDGHPASNGWGIDEAKTLLNQAAVPYLEQVSGGTTTLTIHVHPEVIRAPKSLTAYGEDGSAKDTDSSGTFLPEQLAEEVVLRIKDDVDWADFDLDQNGGVDRLLILHTTKGQEENPSITSRIWSHFTRFETTINLPDERTIDHYTMASLQTGSSGVGTILHEMLHQMGAADLYPLHDEGSFQSWKGPGDWDIMASGNWNGGGRWPAMPTGASMELINAPRIDTLVLEWPAGASKPCIGPSIPLNGVTEGGRILKIQIAPQEFVFIEHRTDTGYDSRLPGHGVLVTYQDRSVGDLEQNELNTNPNLPWLKVIEADQRGDLLLGSNQGEASDLFGNNSMFGANGVPIRTHDGILVHWTASIEVNNNSTTVSFNADDCSPSFQLDFQNHGATLLNGQNLPVTIQSSEACSSSIVSTDGRGVSLEQTGNAYALQFASDGVPNSLFALQGTISCGESSIDVDYPVRVMNRVPTLSSFDGVVDPYDTTTLELPISSQGEGEQVLFVAIDGPLSRIAEAPTTVNLASSVLELNVEPNGLLTNNMLVYGTVTLFTEEGLSWSLDVELKALDSSNKPYDVLTNPAQMYSLFFLTMGLIALSSAIRRQKPPQQKPPELSLESTFENDAWTE
jgi:M6 family metalloprotease-like protein